MKKHIIFLILFFTGLLFPLKAQLQINLSTDIQSRYIWRGQALGGNALTIEPCASLQYKGLAFGAWGAYSLSANNYQELDWFLSYTFWQDRITLLITDYSFPEFSDSYHYFDYRKEYTPHLFEAGLQFSVPKTGLNLSVFTNFYGADAKRENGKPVYSTYCEAMYELEVEKIKTSFDLAVGAAVNGKGNGFYGNNGFGIVNVALGVSKKINFGSSFTLPLYARFIANPVANKLYFVVGATLNL